MARKPGDANISTLEKAAAVAIYATEAKGSAKQAERLTGISHNTILAAAKDPEIRALSGVTKDELASGFRNLTAKLLRRYDEIADSADMSNKGSLLLGIVADKALLYANQPNQITASLDVNQYLQELASRGFSEDDAKAIVEKAQARLSE